MTTPGALVVFLLLGARCGGGESGTNENVMDAGCPDGFRPEGPACAPVFDAPDDCPGPNEMPALGGGCKPVGILQCADGFMPDGTGGCAPILPDHECPLGTMETIGQTECQPVGVVQCAEGFVADGEGGCSAILPPGPDLGSCPPGAIALLGHPTCQPLMDCGAGPEQGGSPWGNVQTDATTVFVDSTADASGAAGTMSAPFPTIGGALAVVAPGGLVAVAAGEYGETLRLDQSVRLVGRCAERVIIAGNGVADPLLPALSIGPGGTSSEVMGVTLTGPGRGLEVSGAQQVTVQDVEVRDASDFGVVVINEADVRLSRVKVSGCTTTGIISQNSTLEVEHSVVRGTRAAADSGRFGRGIEASCLQSDPCGMLSVSSSVVADNRSTGVYIHGIDAVIAASVVHGTLATQTDQTGGDGLYAQCDSSSGRCGSLTVEGSVVAENRSHGIFAIGTDVTTRSSIVRETRPRESDQSKGWGIANQCDSDLGICGSLLVDHSLVTKNHEFGVGASGGNAVVVASAIRDTLPLASDQTGGTGIRFQCSPTLLECGTGTVENSLIFGNRSLGIRTTAAVTTIRSSVVRDTLPQESDDTLGVGISAGCSEYVQTCGHFTMEGTVVRSNNTVGLITEGLDATVLASVVLDTLPQQSDQAYGRGIQTSCDEAHDVCGGLTVEQSLVRGNREIGVVVSGPDATIRNSIVRETRSQESDQRWGMGIAHQCDHLYTGVCGQLTVESSLVAENQTLGIYLVGATGTVLASEVRDTLPQTIDLMWGRGIEADCHPYLDTCASLIVQDSLIRRNYTEGIIAGGADVTIRSSAVLDTRQQASDQSYGRGIAAECDPDTGACGRLSVKDSLVARCKDTGVVVVGVPTSLDGVAVIDITPNQDGPRSGEGGGGIWVLGNPYAGESSTLSMSACLVSSTHGVGVALLGIVGSMTGTVIDTVLAQPADDRYGFGVQIEGLDAAMASTFDVSDSVVRDAKLAGLVYFISTGSLTGNWVSGGEYSVAMNVGSAPMIGEGNSLSGTVRDDPAWVDLEPCPAPPPSSPRTTPEEP